MDLSMMFPKIVELFATKHRSFMEKYSESFLKTVAEHEMARDRIYAKLSLVGKALIDARVISAVKEVDIDSRGEHYARSLMLSSVKSPFPLYMLNDGKSITVTDSVAMVSGDPLVARLICVSEGGHKVNYHFSDALQPSFDWMGFAEVVIDSIHAAIYSREEVMKECVREASATMEGKSGSGNTKP